MARREKVVSTLTGGVSGLFKKNKIELVEGDGRADRRRHRARRRRGAHREDDRARDRLDAARRPGHRVRRPRDRDRGGVGVRRAAEAPRGRRRRRLGHRDRLRLRPPGRPRRTSSRSLDRVLPTEDEDISKVVGRGLTRQGIKVHTGDRDRERRERRRRGHLQRRRRAGRGRLARARAPAAAPTSPRSGSTPPASR